MRSFILPVFVFMSVSCIAQADPEGFVLVKSEPPIEVHERWVEFPGKTPKVVSRELKSEFTSPGTIYDILALLKDETQVRYWQSHLSEYRIYRKPDTTTWDIYSRHDVPWPVSDQDFFMEYKLTEITPGEELHIKFKSKVDHKTAPIQEDVNRIELVGSWKLLQQSPDQVKVTYRIQSAPATNLPRMVVDPVIRNNLLSAIRSLKELAEK